MSFSKNVKMELLERAAVNRETGETERPTAVVPMPVTEAVQVRVPKTIITAEAIRATTALR